MAFQAVVHRPAYEQVAAQLREAILDGAFPPGSDLPAERELCEQFGVSRTTVREALRALQAQGLAAVAGPTAPLRVPEAAALSTGPLRDSLVHLLRLGRVPLSDLVELRCALEAQAAASAARRVANGELTRPSTAPDARRVTDDELTRPSAAPDARRGPRAAATAPHTAPEPARLADHLAAARAELERMRIVGGDVVAFEQADVRFHLALAAASGNEAIQLVMLAVRDSVSAHLLEALHADPAPARAIARLVHEHDAILAAVEAGDARDAEQLLRDHVMGFYRAATRAATTVGSTGSSGDAPVPPAPSTDPTGASAPS